jgi:hypothetical protein
MDKAAIVIGWIQKHCVVPLGINGAELAEFRSAANQCLGIRCRASDSCRSPGLYGLFDTLQS